MTDDQASSWVPSSAESTQALNKLDVFQSPNDIPTVVVYNDAGGLTAATDQSADQEDRSPICRRWTA